MAKFYSAVRAFYVKAVEYMVKKFPYKDPVLLNASVADMSTRDSADFNSIRYFTGRFPCLRMNAEEMEGSIHDVPNGCSAREHHQL